jgi:hypothetical protein
MTRRRDWTEIAGNTWDLTQNPPVHGKAQWVTSKGPPQPTGRDWRCKCGFHDNIGPFHYFCPSGIGYVWMCSRCGAQFHGDRGL